MAQPICSDYSRTDQLPLGSGRLGPAGHDSLAGKPPAKVNICNTPDTIQRGMSVRLVKMADGSPPADIGDDNEIRKMDGEVYHEPTSGMFGQFNVRGQS